MNEADRDRLDVLFAQALRHCVRVRRHQADNDAPCGIEPFLEFKRQVPRYIGLRTLEMKIIGFRPVAAPDLVDVAHALRGEERGARAGALNRRIDGGRSSHG